MLIEFSVGNYRSFNDVATLSMAAAKLSSKDKDLDENTVFDAPAAPPLLTSAAIYGANASGKSNLVEALRFMRQFVLGSQRSTKSSGGIKVDQFRLRASGAIKPSHFEIVFVTDGKRYRYGFELTQERVASEWLYFVPLSREARLFERTGDDIKLGEAFRGEGKEVIHLTRPNALFLSVMAQFNGMISQKLVRWFRNMTVVASRDNHRILNETLREYRSGNYRDDIVRLITRLDVGIDDITLEKITPASNGSPDHIPADLHSALYVLEELIKERADDAFTIKTVHKMYDDAGQEIGRELFDLNDHESEGTRRLFALAGTLQITLREGRVLIIDELDAHLHSLLTREIILLFNSPANEHHAQLIFTTQDTNLLDNRLLRRDQIWFTEKDRQAATQLYSLAEFRVRNDQAFERNYIQGRYGAVPFLGNIQQVLETR